MSTRPSSSRKTEIIQLPQASVGVKTQLLLHHYGPDESNTDVPRCYIQGSLHADELPGMLVCHHLIKLLDAAEQRGDIVKRICVVPYANPIGLSQNLLGSHIGRFSTATGINFNRNWFDVSEALAEKFTRLAKENDEGQLMRGTAGSPAEAHNVRAVRSAILTELEGKQSAAMEVEMKRRLLQVAATSDIVLDLHW